jgi:hypothetical protein
MHEDEQRIGRLAGVLQAGAEPDVADLDDAGVRA